MTGKRQVKFAELASRIHSDTVLEVRDGNGDALVIQELEWVGMVENKVVVTLKAKRRAK